jgi:hypothetical protein
MNLVQVCSANETKKEFFRKSNVSSIRWMNLLTGAKAMQVQPLLETER